MKVLVSAYACGVNRGSESDVGWHWVTETARRHETWVITRAVNAQSIESALRQNPIPQLHFVYVDLPKWLRVWKQLPLGVRAYYYLWQFLAYVPAWRLHRKHHFDVVHHVTFCTYWQPSMLAFIDAPFVWGPVGGGEATPRSFFSSLSARGKLYESSRSLGQALAWLDPFLRHTAHRASLTLATTNETAVRLNTLGCRTVCVFSQVGITSDAAANPPGPGRHRDGAFRICSAGRLEHLKGLEYGLRAVARLREAVPRVEYWIFGDGPERARLTELSVRLGISEQVFFWGETPHADLLAALTTCDVLLHPGLHESGGLICMEAMAAGCPVVCLDLGGLATQVTEETGVKVPALTPPKAICDLACALEELAFDPARRNALGRNARRRAMEAFQWDNKVSAFWELLEQNGIGATIRCDEPISA